MSKCWHSNGAVYSSTFSAQLYDYPSQAMFAREGVNLVAFQVGSAELARVEFKLLRGGGASFWQE